MTTTPACLPRSGSREPRSRRVRRFQLASALAAPLAALAMLPAHADEVDDLLSGEIQRGHLVGLSVAVVRDGQIVKTGAYGLADLELAVPATTNTVFQIQSVTKTFTSAAILLLADEGKLSLDDPVGKYLEGTPHSWKDIKIRHLLSHTSGIKDFINEPTASLRIDVTEEEVLRATAARPLNFAPGERYAYSNTNYHLLAMIIRKLTGKWYGDFLRERIFAPLGMANTRAVSLSDIIPNRASGYHWTGSGFRKGDFIAESILSYGGGGVLSTGPDMARWAQAMMSAKLLKPEAISQAWTPARLNNGEATGYGLGWGIGSVEGHRQVNHGGAHMTGFTSFLAVYPDDRLAVVVLLNRGGANPGRIAQRVAGLYVPELAPKVEKPIEDHEPATAAVLRECITNAAPWRLTDARFTPEMWKVIEAQKGSIQAEMEVLGALQALELLSRSGPDGRRTSRYRATFANGKKLLTLTLDRDGKIAGLESAGEE
jgi:D-alanyl-D-alanine carboxypeptidase